MGRQSKPLAALGVAALLLGVPGAGAAQERLSLHGRMGLEIPTGDLARLENPGLALGIGVAYELVPRVAFRLDGDFSFLSGARTAGGDASPDLDLVHVTGGLQFLVVEPVSTPWSLRANAALGLSRLDFDGVNAGDAYPGVGGGLVAGYELAPRTAVVAGVQGRRISIDPNDFGRALGPSWTVALSAGVSVGLR